MFRFSILTGLLFGTALLLASPAAHAQLASPSGATAAHGYDFLTVTTSEGNKALSFILFAPAFQGKTEIPLETVVVLGTEKFKERVNQNAQLINEQLSALTVAGWELVQVYTTTIPENGSRYLFRKAKS
ncbi:MAG: hypothetical protein EOO62_10540 [Hymenobacter sp.]|nr:MAG: hypothetical protein EOO62_10540 [Hymenobacter sp.]